MGGGNRKPGPTCPDRSGGQTIDGGTNCLWSSPQPGPNSDTGNYTTNGGVDDSGDYFVRHGYLAETEKGHWVFSEFPLAKPAKGKPEPYVEITIKIDESNLAVGKARYTGAKHLNQYIAIHPGGPGNAGTPIIHSNVDLRIKVDGKPVPMTVRRVRYWEIKFATGSTVANEGPWEVNFAKGCVGVWDGPGAEDAPGMNFVNRPPGPIGDLHEFIAGTPKYGGFYYQEVTLYDPDGTARVMVFNVLPLDATQLRDAKKRVDRGVDKHTFLFDAPISPERKHSDSGILRDIPNAALRNKKKR